MKSTVISISHDGMKNSQKRSTHLSSYNSFQMFEINICTPSFRESASVILGLANRGYATYVCVVNAHVAIEAVRCKKYRLIIQQSDCILPDGMPIVWYARKVLGLPDVEKISGPDLMNKCFKDLSDLKHFFYGSTWNTLNKIECRAKAENLNLNIVGSYSPPFRPLTHDERRNIIDMINELSPDIIWVGLGAPKQEYWMNEFKNYLNGGVMIGVGAAFDYFVGNTYRPPALLIRAGLEWLCRLIQEPNRLWKRYLVTNSLFLFLIMKEIALTCLRKRNKFNPKGT